MLIIIIISIADRDMTKGTGSERFERESLLIKGLYGIIKGALSFQVWIEKILKDLEYSKLNYDIARGVYLKTIQDDVVRILRHSDDFRISASQIRRCRATTMTDDYDRGSKCGHIVG